MNRTQRGAAVAVVAVGMIVLAASAAVLISQLLEERAARQGLEREVAELQRQIDSLKARATRFILVD